MRLPASEVITLRLLWGGLASRVGLGSNYSSMIANCLNQADTTQGTREDGMQDGTRALSLHTWNGEPMHVKSSRIVKHGFVCRCTGPCSCEVDLSPVERNACWSNQESKSVRDAYGACKRMVDGGNGHLVGVLYRMYSGEMPFHRYGQFQMLEDLVPIAPDTLIVQKRAVEMSKKEPTSEWQALADLTQRKSGDTKEQDKKREAIAHSIKAECGRLLIRASSAYLEAKKRA